ncbi:MAG: helix-turn-helix transcriptional regulator [Gammaproteobacteria bacterium]|nr:helix-turn-helix transcriptional regulator [Gammaproteobacteria bacterium]
MVNTNLYETLPFLIQSIGEHYFYERVTCSIQALTPIAHARIVSYSQTQRPVFLGENSLSEIDKIYCESAYLLDPVYDDLYDNKNKEFVTLDSLINDDFNESIYYDTFYQRLGWSNETNIVIGTDDDTKICIVYSTKDNHFSQQSANKELTPYLDSIKAVILTHERMRGLIQKNQQIECASLNDESKRYSRLDSLNLTKREKEIVNLILDGFSSAAIAEKCFVSQGTVKNHRKNIYRKLGIKSQAQLFRNCLQ